MRYNNVHKLSAAMLVRVLFVHVPSLKYHDAGRSTNCKTLENISKSNNFKGFVFLKILELLDSQILKNTKKLINFELTSALQLIDHLVRETLHPNNKFVMVV